MLLLMLACGGDTAEQVFTGEIFTDAETATGAIAVTGGVVVAVGADAEAMVGSRLLVRIAEGSRCTGWCLAAVEAVHEKASYRQNHNATFMVPTRFFFSSNS